MSKELSWGLKECMGIAFLVNMSTIVLMVLELLKENQLLVLQVTYVWAQTPSLYLTYLMFASPLGEKWNRDTVALR